MKKALLVGINDYPQAPLRGCVNDVLLMHKMVTEHFGFKADKIKVLTDAEATKKNITTQLRNLVNWAEKGDNLLFHFSGHGSQVVVNDWTNTSESDGRDEILCSVDLDWNNPLRDNDLGDMIKKVPQGVQITVILDCCHSGTGLRASFEGPDSEGSTNIRNRFLPPPPSNILSNPRVKIDDDLTFVFPDSKDLQTQKRGFLIDTTEQGEAILISGCQDNQTSADAYISNAYRGACTYMLFEILRRASFDISYRDLITQTNKFLDQAHYSQNPQLECIESLKDKPFLR